MEVSLEVSQHSIMPMVFMVIGALCVLVLLWASPRVSKSPQEEAAAGDAEETSGVVNLVAFMAALGTVVFFLLAVGAALSYELHKMDPLEAAYAEQHGVTNMSAQVNRSSELGSLVCLPNEREGSVSYKWTDADGTRKSGLLKKESPDQGECEYTLTAVE